MRKIFTFINLLGCSAAYLVISSIVKKISIMRDSVSKWFLNFFVHRYRGKKIKKLHMNICSKQWEDAENYDNMFL